MVNTATLTFGYAGTDFTRKYKFEGLTLEQCEALKAKVIGFNASIAGGTDDGLKDFFLSDDYVGGEIGKFSGIVAAQYESATITDIPLT